MKKLLVFLLLLPLVYAAPEDPVTSTERTFTLQVEFDTAVNVVGQARITARAPLSLQRSVSATNPSADGTTYDFAVTSPLPNGVYDFVLTYRKIGNYASDLTFRKQITVAAPEEEVPQLFNISLVSPTTGFHDKIEEFEIILQTEYPATCRYLFNYWDVYDNMINTEIVDSADGITHTLTYPSTNNNEQIYWIGCITNDDARLESYKKFLFGFTDGSSEIISVSQEPNPVKDKSERYADLEIRSSDKSYCMLSYNSAGTVYTYPSVQEFDEQKNNFSQYNLVNSLRLCFKENCEGLEIPESYDRLDSAEYKYPINIVCLNRAGLSNSTNFNATVKYTNDPGLSYVRPNNFESASPVQINLVSALNMVWCKYNIDGTLANVNEWDEYSGGSKNFTTTANLAEGKHNITSKCQNQYSPTLIEAFKEFTVDRAAPTGFTYNIPTDICQDKEFEISWEAEDAVSGIDKFHYEILNGTELIDSGSFGSKSKDLELDLEPGDYTFKPSIRDEAGNIATAASKTIHLLNKSAVQCDDERPEVVVKQFPENETTDFQVRCEDEDSGCKDTFKYNVEVGSKTSKVNCTYDTTGTIDNLYTVELTSVLCYQVEDKAGNKVEGKEKITVDLSDNVDRCENGIKDGDETDTDCGGSCDRCSSNNECEENSDCGSGLCTDNICQEEEFECYFDWECTGGKICEYPNCVEPRSPGNNTPGPTDPNPPYNPPEDSDDSSGINWTALIIGILGVVLLGGGGFFYFANPGVPASAKSSLPTDKPKMPDLSINKQKNLDLKDTKRVKELRDKLSKQKPNNKRKNMLRAFETPEVVDKETPAGIEKTNVDLIPRLKPKTVAKKVPNVESITEKQENKTPKKKTKKSEEFIPIEKLNKKKDVFDELEDL